MQTTSLDGSPNPDYAGRAVPRHDDTDRGAQRPAYEGFLMFQATADDGWRRVGAQWDKHRKRYEYAARMLSSWDGAYHANEWAVRASAVDSAIDALLTAKMRSINAADLDKITASDLDGNAAQDIKRLKSQIATLDRDMDRAAANIPRISNPVLLAKTEERFTAMEQEKKRLEARLMEAQARAGRGDDFKAVEEFLHFFLLGIVDLSAERMAKARQFFVDRVEATHTDGALSLVVYWKDGTTETVAVDFKLKLFTAADIEKFKALYDAGVTDPLQYMAVTPMRTWAQVRNVCKTRGVAPKWDEPTPYLNMTGEQTVTLGDVERIIDDLARRGGKTKNGGKSDRSS